MDEDQDQLTAGGLPPAAMSFVVPGVPAEWAAAELAARHASYTGTHSHPHPTYGSQGGDATHEHMHAHDGDSNHGHEHGEAAAIEAAGWAAVAPDLAALLASAHAAVPEGGSLVAAAMAALGSPWGLEQRGERWAVLGRDGAAAEFTGDDAQAQAVAELGRLAFADQQQRPVLADTWRSEMCFEGTPTPDGRLMEPGALEYRDTPMPLMLQTTTDVGHYGAVLAGAILQAGTVGGVAIGSGEFDDTEAGRQFLQIVEARGRFGVSIDGTYPAEAEVECVEYDDDGWCLAIQVRFKQLTVGGLCYSDDTEVLSEHGWTRFAELPKGERVATRNPKTGVFEWQEPVHYTNDRWTSKMIRFRGPRVDLLVTPNHRMLVKSAKNAPERFMRADDLAAKTSWKGIHNYGIPATSKWEADDVRTFRIERTAVPDGFCRCGCGQTLPESRAANRTRCSIDGCARPSHGHGMCSAHYQRQRRHGDPLAGGPFRDDRQNRHLVEPPVTLPGHGHGYSTVPLLMDGDTFAAFMGAWLAEGSLNVKSRQISLSQMPSSRGFEPYRRMLADLTGREPRHTGTKFVIRDARLLDYLRQFGHAADKFMPAELKNFSARQLRIFFDHYMLGDGSADGRRASTVSPRLADDLQEVAQKIGLWAKITRIVNDVDRAAPGGRTIKAANCRDTYRLDFYNRPDASRAADKVWAWDVEEVDYDGMVRCVTVPNESLYVRRNGKALWCGNTGTPFPAFPDAYIALERRAEQASGEHHGAEGDPRGQGDVPCEDCADPPATADQGEHHVEGNAHVQVAGTFPAGRAATDATGRTATIPFTAAAAPAEPPAEWFADPEFRVGDSRLVLQPDGRHYACPLTVTADGRVFGHMATWFTCHTGYQASCVTPPRSKTGYAGFLLRPLMTADGTPVHVGHLTMGCGHASTDGRMSVDAVRAHYDGGPGAVRMAHVACGEDQFGIWFAGALNPEATPAQVREFAACSVSGDWREVWRGKGLDLVACLAGVTVPGFPVASALAAAGLQVLPLDDAAALPAEPVARYVDGRPAVLVAAGVVRRQAPWEVLHAEDQRRMDLLEERLGRAELVTAELRPLAAERLLASIEAPAVPAAANGNG